MITILEDVAFAAIVLGCLLAFTALAGGAGWAWDRRRRPRREYPPLNRRVPMPPGPDPLAAPWGRCGCELVWRPCQIHDPGWLAEMERMTRP
jgi:hypothetical protein